jgi:hypothetical protein
MDPGIIENTNSGEEDVTRSTGGGVEVGRVVRCGAQEAGPSGSPERNRS